MCASLLTIDRRAAVAFRKHSVEPGDMHSRHGALAFAGRAPHGGMLKRGGSNLKRIVALSGAYSPAEAGKRTLGADAWPVMLSVSLI